MGSRLRSGGVAVVEALLKHGSDTAFCVPGESYLPILDALYDVQDSISLYTCRHEAGAANMAEAYGKLTGQPGICLVTRGPGAAHAAIGVHTARQDSTPMILLVGQVATGNLGREAFQEVDFETMFAPLAKWAVEVKKADDIPRVMAKGFQVALSGRKGPVVISLPEDILSGPCKTETQNPLPIEEAAPTPADIEKCATLLKGAKHPLVILGGSGWDNRAVSDFREFAEREGLPVGCAFRFQDLMDPRSANYIGDIGIGINPKLAERVKGADVILALGPRLGEMTTSDYTLIKPPKPDQTLIHVHAGGEELGRVYDADLKIHSSARNFVGALKTMKLGKKNDWAAGLKQDRQTYLDWSTPNKNPGAVQVAEIYGYLRETLPENAILTNGAGNYTAWLHRFYHYRGFKTQLAPTSGAMGYGVPAAIAAKIRHPGRPVICIAGDGCFMMSAQELATATQYNSGVIFLVFNNAMYGTIRMHQEKHYPGRVSGTGLKNPDFAALAESFGIRGYKAATNKEFEKAFDKALKSGQAALIEVKVDPEAISPTATLSGLKAK